MRQVCVNSHFSGDPGEVFPDGFEIPHIIDQTPPFAILDETTLWPEMYLTEQVLFIQPVTNKGVEVINVTEMLLCPGRVLVIPAALFEIIPGGVETIPGISDERELEVAVEIPPTEYYPVLYCCVMIRQFIEHRRGDGGSRRLGDMHEDATMRVILAKREITLGRGVHPATQFPKLPRVSLFVKPEPGFIGQQSPVQCLD